MDSNFSILPSINKTKLPIFHSVVLDSSVINNTTNEKAVPDDIRSIWMNSSNLLSFEEKKTIFNSVILLPSTVTNITNFATYNSKVPDEIRSIWD